LGDESRLRAMGKCARQVAEEKFGASKIIPQYEQFYREMIEASA
jgi:glycosyltransferase involved in cell wall biosynthesis